MPARLPKRESPAERRLLERLLEARRITVARLRAEGWTKKELSELLPALESRHALRVVERGAGRPPGATVGAVVLAELPPEERARRIGSAPAQARVVAWLAELGRPVLEGELVAACNCSPGVVAGLVRKGVLQRFRQDRHRDVRRWELAPPPPPTELTEHQQRALAVVFEAPSGRRSIEPFSWRA